MKAMKAGSAMTATAAYSSVAESTSLKAKDVKAAVEGIIAVAAAELKKNGSFKIAGMLNMKLKKKAAAAREKFLKDQADARRSKVKDAKQRREQRGIKKKEDIMATYASEDK